jgi:hypothetical protein
VKDRIEGLLVPIFAHVLGGLTIATAVICL